MNGIIKYQSPSDSIDARRFSKDTFSTMFKISKNQPRHPRHLRYLMKAVFVFLVIGLEFLFTAAAPFESTFLRLAEDLKSKNNQTQEKAILHLNLIGPLAEAGILALGETLKEPEELSPEVWHRVLSNMDQIVTPSLQGISELNPLLSDNRRPSFVHAIAENLSGMNAAVIAALPIYRDAVLHPNAGVRHRAVQSIQTIMPQLLETFEIFKLGLKNQDRFVRFQAISNLGQASKVVISYATMTKFLTNSKRELRDQTTWTLSQAHRMIQVLMDAYLIALQDEDPEVRDEALKALEQIAVAMAAELPDLLNALHSKDQTACAQSMMILKQIAVLSKQAVAVLERNAQNISNEDQSSALHFYQYALHSSVAALNEETPGIPIFLQ